MTLKIRTIGHTAEGADVKTDTKFDTPLPEGLSYHLLFGYRHDSLFGAESSDGVIKLTSQLRYEAQARADSISGYDEGHVSILHSNATLRKVGEILDSN